MLSWTQSWFKGRSLTEPPSPTSSWEAPAGAGAPGAPTFTSSTIKLEFGPRDEGHTEGPEVTCGCRPSPRACHLSRLAAPCDSLPVWEKRCLSWRVVGPLGMDGDEAGLAGAGQSLRLPSVTRRQGAGGSGPALMLPEEGTQLRARSLGSEAAPEQATRPLGTGARDVGQKLLRHPRKGGHGCHRTPRWSQST